MVCKKLLLLFCLVTLCSAARGQVTILQGPSAPAIAWEAENHGTLINDPIESWAVTNETAANAGAALTAVGANNTAAPLSFVDYRLRFAAPGSYRFYYRWRAHEVPASADRFTANSFYAPNAFNTGTNVAEYHAAASNGSDAQGNPSSTNYTVLSEATSFDITQETIDAGEVVTLRIGTRERGLTLDRIVLTTDIALTESAFNATPNSDVDIFAQPSGATHIAFEAETPKAAYLNDPLEVWAVTNEPAASGGAALTAVGANNTAAPLSFADYRLRFATPGSYRFYYRWRAHEVPASADRFTANSFYAPNAFNTGTNVTEYHPAASNGSDAQGNPSSTNYTVISEPTSFDITQAMIDAGEIVTLRLGTRERGMTIDRIVLSTDIALSEAGFNALPNTGIDSAPPVMLSALASVNFTNVTIFFDEVIDASSVEFFNFTASGGLQILGVQVDPVGLKKVLIHTSPQTPGSTYTITVTGVQDLSGNTIPMNSTINFRAWALAPGWVTREMYENITGNAVDALRASPKFPDSPDSVSVFPGLVMVNDPGVRNFGLRIRGFFTPQVTGQYEFYLYADDQAELWLSTDESAASLQRLVITSYVTNNFSEDVKGSLPFETWVAGQRYLIEVLFKQESGSMRLGVGAARVGDTGPIMPLVGNLVSSYVNPDTASVTFNRQPQGTNITAGFSARFEADASSPGGSISYQWQANGADIPGANRPVYVTPALTVADSGKRYRVVARAGGATLASSEAVVTVVAGPPPAAQPYVGVNFVGDTDGILEPADRAGVVYQNNFNNVFGGSATALPLNDADGNATPVTLTFTGAIRYTGAGRRSADDVLFDGYVQNNNTPMTVTLSGVAPGNYGLLVYSVGFPFQTIYDQAFGLLGQADYPAFRIRAQDGLQYVADRRYIRMDSTDPSARDFGNYVMFENVGPDANGALVLTMTPEPPATPGVGDAMPALNALQLVRMSVGGPTLSATRNPNATMTISWSASADGYTLTSSPSLGSAPWSAVSGAPNPISGAGSVTVPTTGMRFFRFERP